MKIISDKGTLRNRLNTKMADGVVNLFGQRVNYILRYLSHRHRWPHFNKPRDMSEYILGAMLRPDFLKFADYADKVKVRDYIKSKGLEHLLLRQYGTWQRAEEIDFQSLPDKFILKSNNGCGGHVLCTGKSQINEDEVRRVLAASLLTVKKLSKTEPHYRAIEPRILCEELLGDGKQLPMDFKFLCVKGEVVCVLLAFDRDDGNPKKATVDKDWNPLPYIITHGNNGGDTLPPRPGNFDEMVRYARILSADFDFVRVDLYNYEGKIYFGELTFSPMGGIFSTFTTGALEEMYAPMLADD